MPNFSSLAGLEVTEKFVWVDGVVVGSKWLICLTLMKLLLSCFELSRVELRWVLTIKSEIPAPIDEHNNPYCSK